MKIAMCGLDCAVCPAYIVHYTGDKALQEKTAKQWKEEYGAADITPEMVDCVGCTVAEGVHIGHCFECEIRKCGLVHQVENCAVCVDYPCAVVTAFIEKVPPAKANLENIRAAAKAKTKAKIKSKAKAKPKVKPKGAAKSKAKTKAKSGSKPKAKPKAKPKTKTKPKAKAKAKAKTKAGKR